MAPPGQKIVASDLSNIEGRVLAWLAEEQWKLDAFSDFDKGIGPDLYCAAYGKAFGVDPKTIDKKDPRRQIGKILELAMGFGGGVGSFVTFSLLQDVDLESLASSIELPEDVVIEAKKFWDWREETGRSTYNLSEKVFIACDSLKRLWRRSHPMITSLWSEVEKAAKNAVTTGESSVVRKVVVSMRDNWLLIKLPSGRFLSYPAPRVEGNELSFLGINQFKRKWERIKTYGGKLVENKTQAFARDVFKANYSAILRAGYSIRFPVHDELVTYAPCNEMYNPDALSKLLAKAPFWAPGLPLAAAGVEGPRYQK